MTAQEAVVALVLSELDALCIPYMLVGSFASTRHGAPRMTQDADIVIEAELARLLELARRLASAFYVSEPAVREATRRRGMFNLIHLETGLKIDLILRKERAFSVEELRRREAGPLGGRVVFFATAEDTVLSKLEWAKRGASDRQSLDAQRVVQVQGARLDWGYMRVWARELDVTDLLDRLDPARSDPTGDVGA